MSRVLQKLGRYILTGEIASGGMARVYRAKLIGVRGFAKDVAIKKILPHWTDEREFVDMLIDEAKILVHLQHNNIVQVFELGQEKGSYFIVMEYVDGFDLRKIIIGLKRKRLIFPLELSCYIIKQICLGLSFAHSRVNRQGESLQIVHRDISPQNILISGEGDIKITDFGIARIKGKTHKTAAGVLKGKYSYMSPEQVNGQNVDCRTDIFALGTLFYELVTGKKCFDGDNDLQIMERVKGGELVIPQNLPPTLKDIFHRSLCRDRSGRYQSAREMYEAVAGFENQTGFCSGSAALKDFINNFVREQKTQILDELTGQGDEDTKIAACQTEILTLVGKNFLTTLAMPETKIPDDPVFTADRTCLDLKTIANRRRESSVNHHLSWSLKRIMFRNKVYAGLLVAFIVSVVTIQTVFSSVNETILRAEEVILERKVPQLAGNFVQAAPFFDSTEMRRQDREIRLVIEVPPQPEPIKYGSVRIQARPWGIASVKGLGQGYVPAVFKVPTGKQLASVFYSPKKTSVSRFVTVEEGKEINCRASLGMMRNSMVCR